MKYNSLNLELLKELQSMLAVPIKYDEETLERYSRDETAELKAVKPEVVVFPVSTEEVSDVMRFANRHLIPVTPRGAGTGLSGGAVPAFHGIVMSLEKMNRILEFDAANMMITVEPGVITGEIQKLADRHGLVYGGDPCSSESSSIGGNIAENAGGNKVMKYGPTGYHVYGLEVVLPSGEVTRLGGKMIKDVSGLDLIHLIVGSEGTLGIATRITLRLLPKPKYSVALLIPFPDIDTAIAAVPKLMTGSGVVPTSLEFMDASSIKAVCSFLNMEFPYADAGAHLIVEVEGSSKDSVFDDYVKLGESAIEAGGLEAFVADNRNTREKLWKARKSIAEALASISPVHCMEDVSVPMASIPELIKFSEEIARERGLEMIAFGHAGDGNVHVSFIKGDMPEERWNEALPLALEELYAKTTGLGGCISGEHGIGLKRKKYLASITDRAQLDLIRGIKRAFDPSYILNPGKIVDL
ncbi:FAD/FMN-dependent dehydrogenase [Mesotoga infera]|uniref:FAD/FMN-dependent dehydrogenase n=1 Tax=Mesotoga infera TaxID=1236046 RepID=A0A7Z7PNY1_9BACT|nr:FAD-binding oxidoreductase [Mesotoga infera]SSC12766.1 FAD/FMN-dependent dehydrogenase [Mesotoga infera]HNS67392.1 FAD-binding oxidoreductase [Mesotoga infera]